MDMPHFTLSLTSEFSTQRRNNSITPQNQTSITKACRYHKLKEVHFIDNMIMLIISLVAGVYVVRGLTTTSSTNHVKNLIKKWIENTDFEQKTKMCLLAMNDPAMASALTSKLYRASMVGTLEELYFLSRSEMECPCGAVSSIVFRLYLWLHLHRL